MQCRKKIDYSISFQTETASVDADIQKEYARQREHLERSVASLRKKLSKDTEIHRADNVRIMQVYDHILGVYITVANNDLSQENVSLIKEINDLRRELKITRTQEHDLEAALSHLRKNTGQNASEAVAQIASTNKNAILERELKEKVKVIDLQQGEIVKLRNEIQTLEAGQISRPPSGGRLPPVAAN
jgi:hypothetical protein